MNRLCLTIALSLALSGCSVFGVRSGTEQTKYEVVDRVLDSVEIRRYETRLAAEVTVAANSEDDPANSAFRILARYIFGANRARSDIAMTSPVEIQGEPVEIAMTAPVEMTKPEAEQMTMRFFLPASITLENAPQPDDDRIRIYALPASTVATITFTGLRTDTAFQRERAELLKTLGKSDWRPTDEPVGLYYDPPWTIPFLRRNEVAVTVVAN